MSRYNYNKYKILIDPDSNKVQGLKVGDVVRRQYFDGQNLIYSLIVVMQTGVDTLYDKVGKELCSPYFVGALIEGNEPQNGELLDFARVTNLFDSDRSGALYLTASDNAAPYMDVIDGVATENSLCYPYMGDGMAEEADSGKYAAVGIDFLLTEYKESEGDVCRIFRMTRNDISNPELDTIGLKQTLERKVAHPQRVIISYKIRASRSLNGVELHFGYVDGQEVDGTDNLNISTEWEYKLSLITLDYPEAYTRSLTIDLTEQLHVNDWCEIAELNLVLLSDVVTFSIGTKVRIGKIRGIVDPVFGLLNGYGAYFQSLYATRNVNVAGTLTAGDEKGYASTFYVGRIHKNCLINSLYGNFMHPVVVSPTEKAPAGIGHVFQLPAGITGYRCQSEEWALVHHQQKYCFSFWAKSRGSSISLRQNTKLLAEFSTVSSGEWCRYHTSFVTDYQLGKDFVIEMECTTPTFFCSPQLESGDTPTLYQATDNKLNLTDEYGAWFCQGGIGGTIQNPLLRLNSDGSIEAGNKSFVIQPDGTGYFAGGRFRWTEDTITLQDVTIRWEDFDQQTQENLLPKSVGLVGTDTFHYTDALDLVCEPTEIIVTATELNFIGASQRWQYLSTDGNWKDIGTGTNICITPSFHAWEERDVLTLKYLSVWNDTEFTGTHTITKQYDGQGTYRVDIISQKGFTIKNNSNDVDAKAILYYNGEELDIAGTTYTYTWKLWDATGTSVVKSYTGKSITVPKTEVNGHGVLMCEVSK